MGSNLTDEEHQARAMLMGLRYHDGNGTDPFYYKMGANGEPDVASFIDADTLEPILQHKHDPYRVDWTGLKRRMQAKRSLRMYPYDYD